MKKLIFFISITISFVTLTELSVCQLSSSYIDINNEAKEHITRLHDSSVLLVRLQTRELSLQAYRDAGQNKFANKKELEQKALNQQIVNAFRKNFNFCDVYFFYTDKSSNIIDEEYWKVTFLNDSLQEDPTILPDLVNQYYYVAEFRVIRSETMIQGLALMDSKLNQLSKPFPYYAKNPFFASKSKFAFTTVKRFNNNLHRYYQNTK